MIIESTKKFFQNLTDVQRYILFGGSTALAAVLLYRSRMSKSQSEEDFSSYIYVDNADILEDPNEYIKQIRGFDALSSPNSLVPAVAFKWNPNHKGYDFFILNFTPKRASDVEEGEITKYLTAMRNIYNDNSAAYISNNDIEVLVSLGIIPLDFDYNKAAFSFSNNGYNQYLIGYSDPYIQSTNRDGIKVITPIWGVSFGSRFDTSSAPDPMYTQKELDDIYEYGSKMLFGEFMLTRGQFGCASSIGEYECAFEKIMIMNCLLSRWDLKRQKIRKEIPFSSVFFGPYEVWNARRAFLSRFNNPLTNEAVQNARKFFNKEFWNMPKIGYSTTHFIHHYSMSKYNSEGKSINPSWTKTTSTLLNVYPAQYPIRIGQAIAIDNSKYFK